MINKIKITGEAQFDYEEIVARHRFPNLFKQDLEEYITHKNPTATYFYAKYYDETTSSMLLLFFRKGMSFRGMQIWTLVGICDQNDYSEDIEECGLIKNWLDQTIAG